jgi:adenylate kinase family enzyme
VRNLTSSLTTRNIKNKRICQNGKRKENLISVLVQCVGPPASGKTSLCQELFKRYNIRSLSVDNIQRTNNELENDTSKENDDSALNVLINAIEEGKREGREKYAIDGFVPSAEQLTTLQQKIDASIIVFIILKCPTKILKRPLLNRRSAGQSKENNVLCHSFCLKVWPLVKILTERYPTLKIKSKESMSTMLNCVDEFLKRQLIISAHTK